MRRSTLLALLFTVVALSAGGAVTPGFRARAATTLASAGAVSAQVARATGTMAVQASRWTSDTWTTLRTSETTARLLQNAAAGLASFETGARAFAERLGVRPEVGLAVLVAVLALLVLAAAFAARQRSRHAPYRKALQMLRSGAPAARVGRQTHLAQDAVRWIGKRA